mgnify:FL=1
MNSSMSTALDPATPKNEGEENDDLLNFLMNDDGKATNQSSNPSGLQTTESATIEDEYEYTDSSSGEEDVQIILNADDRVVAEKRLDQNAEGTNEGNVYIPDEDMKSAFEIDINKLKLRKWEMTGDESDYFNYGMNESMWKDYALLINRRRGKVNIKELRELSDNLITQASYLPYSTAVARGNSHSYRPHFREQTNLSPDKMEQFYSILNNPEAFKEVMRKINEQNGDTQPEEESRDSGRFHSRRRYSTSRSRNSSDDDSRHSSSDDDRSHRSSRRHHSDRHHRSRRNRDSRSRRSDSSEEDSDRYGRKTSSSKRDDSVEYERSKSAKRYRR